MLIFLLPRRVKNTCHLIQTVIHRSDRNCPFQADSAILLRKCQIKPLRHQVHRQKHLAGSTPTSRDGSKLLLVQYMLPTLILHQHIHITGKLFLHHHLKAHCKIPARTQCNLLFLLILIIECNLNSNSPISHVLFPFLCIYICQKEMSHKINTPDSAYNNFINIQPSPGHFPHETASFLSKNRYFPQNISKNGFPPSCCPDILHNLLIPLYRLRGTTPKKIQISSPFTGASGNTTMNSVPLKSLLTDIVPPCRSIIFFAMASPSPVPPCSSVLAASTR